MTMENGMRNYVLMADNTLMEENAMEIAHEIEIDKAKPPQDPTANKKWPCTLCEKVYAGQTMLKIHINTQHLKIRLTCLFCTNTYAQKVSLVTHMKKNHPENAPSSKPEKQKVAITRPLVQDNTEPQQDNTEPEHEHLLFKNVGSVLKNMFAKKDSSDKIMIQGGDEAGPSGIKKFRSADHDNVLQTPPQSSSMSELAKKYPSDKIVTQRGDEAGPSGIKKLGSADHDYIFQTPPQSSSMSENMYEEIIPNDKIVTQRGDEAGLSGIKKLGSADNFYIFKTPPQMSELAKKYPSDKNMIPDDDEAGPSGIKKLGSDLKVNEGRKKTPPNLSNLSTSPTLSFWRSPLTDSKLINSVPPSPRNTITTERFAKPKSITASNDSAYAELLEELKFVKAELLDTKKCCKETLEMATANNIQGGIANTRLSEINQRLVEREMKFSSTELNTYFKFKTEADLAKFEDDIGSDSSLLNDMISHALTQGLRANQPDDTELMKYLLKVFERPYLSTFGKISMSNRRFYTDFLQVIWTKKCLDSSHLYHVLGEVVTKIKDQVRAKRNRPVKPKSKKPPTGQVSVPDPDPDEYQTIE